MTDKPKYRNYSRRDFLLYITLDEYKDWGKEFLERTPADPDEVYVHVFSPSYVQIYILSIDLPQKEKQSFQDWVELVTSVHLVKSSKWPILHLKSDPPEGWEDKALDMPCRDGGGTMFDRRDRK